ncbi:TolC family protein [Candidatus Deferrimicrobium sp.]|uniref:TolC family protein n=1 Tax=Candidatus Deferrimicrobium sp. TaxID=3060586 RepID=UPI003C57C913
MARPARFSPRSAFPGAAMFLLTSVFPLLPAASAMESVDFRQAVARALSNNAIVQAAGEEAISAQKDADAARGYLLPSVRFDDKFVRTTVPAEAFGLKMNQEKLLASDFADVSNFNSPPPRNDFIATLSLEQPLFAPKAYIGYGMAKVEADAKGQDLYRRKEDAVYRVLAAVLDVITARQFVDVAGQGLSDAREHLRIAESLEAAGMGLASDALRAKVAVATAEGAKVTAESRLELARRRLALAMGEPGAPPVDVTGPPPEFPDPGTPGERDTGTTGRADLRASSLRVANAGSDVRRWQAGYLPDVGLAAAYQVDAEDSPFSTDNRSWKVGVGLTWNLFDGMRREAEVGKAAASLRRARAYHRGMLDQAAFEAAQADLGVKEATLREEIARAALASAEEGVRLLTSRYENRLGRMVDLLDAQTALDGARAVRIRAENDVRLSRAQRLYASGGLLSFAAPSEEHGKEKNR